MDQPQGNAPPTEGVQGSDAPKAITLEEVNRAITARFSSFEKKYDKSLDEKLTGLFGKFEESFSAKLAEAKPKTEPAPDKPPSIEEHPQFRGLQKQLADLKAQADAAKAERDAERAKTREQAMRSRVREALEKRGLEGLRLTKAVGDLIDASKLVRWADDDSISFRDASGEEVDLDTGLDAWAKSDDGKFYLPPRGTSGSGDRPMVANGRGNNAPPDPMTAAKELLLKHLTGQ